MKKALPFVLRYLVIVVVSCCLAFLISQSRVEAAEIASNIADSAVGSGTGSEMQNVRMFYLQTH